jgi:2-haloacid dehalogenase
MVARARSPHGPHRLDTGDSIDTVVFDLGAVLIDWNPRYLYRSLFSGPEAEADIEHFLATICTPDWNLEQDRGRPVAEATSLLVEQHPEHAELIKAYYDRWDEMLGDPIEGTVEIAHELIARGVRAVALTNWSAETFPRARNRLGFLDNFDAVLVSGTVGLAKPDPAIFELFIRRHQVNAAHAVFIDDSPKNVAAAADVGFDAILFESPEKLRIELHARHLVEGTRSSSL